VKVLEIIQKSAAFLERKGVESPRLQSELILAHVLGLPRLQLYLNFERPVPEAQEEKARELVRRRGTREPLQHLIGSASFWGLEMLVNRDVLIPRPETELLGERARDFLRTWPGDTPRILDFGTGSGCLAIWLARQFPTARILAIDISPVALAVAAQNARRHGVGDRIEFCQHDGLPAPGEPCALVVSNPPYIPSAEIATLEPEVRDHDPRAALDGGPDGLDHYRHLALAAPAWLAPGGRMMLEFGDGQAAAITGLLHFQKWIVEPPIPDYSGRERILAAGR
jgi:release factor glutamine methyltransferase